MKIPDWVGAAVVLVIWVSSCAGAQYFEPQLGGELVGFVILALGLVGIWAGGVAKIKCAAWLAQRQR